MKKKSFLRLIVLVLAFFMILVGCRTKQPPQTKYGVRPNFSHYTPTI